MELDDENLAMAVSKKKENKKGETDTKKKRKEGNQSVTDEQLEDKEMGKLMTMSKNIYSMTGVDFLDVNKGDQPFLYM